MKRFAATISISALLASQLMACCPASAGQPVWMTQETAIIVWDSKKKVQHFIRQASFDTKAKDFGFIVPLPSVPDFAVANPAAFDRLASLVPEPRGIGCAAPTEEAAAAGSIEVLKEERVGDYRATVVRASDGEAMNSWLRKNGFKHRPQMTEWLEHYTKKQWVFAALKYVATPNNTTNTQAVRISFKTDRPHYPYKMPSDAFKPGWVRPLKLYVVADTPIDANLLEADAKWAGERRWSGDLPAEQYAGLAEELKLQTEDLPKDAVVSIFENGSRESKYDDDLVFAASTDWSAPIWGGVVVLMIGAWLFTQRNRRRPIPSPA